MREGESRHDVCLYVFLLRKGYLGTHTTKKERESSHVHTVIGFRTWRQNVEVWLRASRQMRVRGWTSKLNFHAKNRIMN